METDELQEHAKALVAVLADDVDASVPDEAWDLMGPFLETQGDIFQKALEEIERHSSTREFLMMCTNVVAQKKIHTVHAKCLLLTLVCKSLVRCESKKLSKLFEDCVWLIHACFDWKDMRSAQECNAPLHVCSELLHTLVQLAQSRHNNSNSKEHLLPVPVSEMFRLFKDLAGSEDEVFRSPSALNLLRVLYRADLCFTDIFQVRKDQIEFVKRAQTKLHHADWDEEFEEEFVDEHEDGIDPLVLEHGALARVDVWSKLGVAQYLFCLLVCHSDSDVSVRLLSAKWLLTLVAPYCVELIANRESMQVALCGIKLCQAICDQHKGAIETLDAEEELECFVKLGAAIADYVVAHPDRVKRGLGLSCLRVLLGTLQPTPRMNVFSFLYNGTQVPALRALLVDELRFFCLQEFDESETSPFAASKLIPRLVDMVQDAAATVDLLEQNMDPIMALFVALQFIWMRLKSMGNEKIARKIDVTRLVSIANIVLTHVRSIQVQANTQLSNAVMEEQSNVSLREPMSAESFARPQLNSCSDKDSPFRKPEVVQLNSSGTALDPTVQERLAQRASFQANMLQNCVQSMLDML